MTDKSFKTASLREKTDFFLYLVETGDDYAKIGFVWVTCFNREYIRTRLEKAFEEDLQLKYLNWKDTKEK